MGTEFRYKLQPYSGRASRYTCPECNRQGVFVRYVDENGVQVHDSVGRCNREGSCGYHYTPSDYSKDTGTVIPKQYSQTVTTHKPMATSYIPDHVYRATLGKEHHLRTYLMSIIGRELTDHALEMYNVGASKHWPGATVFWQVDVHGKVRTGKVMLYDPMTGKRVREPFSHITWAHSVMGLTDYNLRQCLFGEHLIVDNSKKICLVESEKTAIIASAYLPKFTWLATGGMSNFSPEKCQTLSPRGATLFPDLNGIEAWKIRAAELQHLGPFKVSLYIDSAASTQDRASGADLADILVRYSVADFMTKR